MDKKVKKMLDPLSTVEKLDVIEYLTKKLSENDISLSDEHRNIIRERELAYNTGNTTLHTWEEVQQSTNK